MKRHKLELHLLEAFGDPIGSYAGDAPVGVRSVEDDCECQACGMMPIDGLCACNSLTEGAEPCEGCGMYEVEGSCGCTHLEETDMEEVAPPGKEKMVKALKKDPDIDNPWAVAWAQHNKEKRK